MPRATVNLDTESFELKTCPGGMVVLRRMTYGEKMTRQNLAMDMSFEDQAASAKLQLDQVTVFSFGACVVSHNLEDENGLPLNMKSAADVRRLDPKIGEEIEALIDKMNNYEADPGN